MDYQDWEPVVIRKSHRVSQEDKARQLSSAVRSGTAASVGKQTHLQGSMQARKLEDDNSTYKHATASVDLRLAIQQARTAKGMTQKDLAAAISEKQTVINAYESGAAVPTGQILAKLDRVLNTRLPRPKK